MRYQELFRYSQLENRALTQKRFIYLLISYIINMIFLILLSIS